MVRLTFQKMILEKALSSFDSFFSAEDLYRRTMAKKIGLATVYRFLNYLESQRKIHTYICNNRKIYSKELSSHIHFFCSICGKKEHLELKKLDFLKNLEFGEVCHFQIDLTGKCNLCIKKNSDKHQS